MNSMFFFFDIEKRIGLKKLTNADLGASMTSNQTHIGLNNDVLRFLGNNVVTEAMLVYDNYCQILNCFFDRIENPDGSFRSPKIRSGLKNEDSIVSKIREFALTNRSVDWYLLWSGLENKDLVFCLINSTSSDATILKSLVGPKARTISVDDRAYATLKNIMINRINLSSIDMQKDIEIISQTGVPSKKYKPFDLEKAKRNIAKIGKKGEELVNDYLERLKSLNEIETFEWLNKSRESGLPYDFILNQEHYIDVKSTRFDFSQNIVFSNQEVGFINQLESNFTYFVYRVFDITETNANLKICTQCMPYIQKINTDVQTFNDSIAQNKTTLLGLNVAVSPADCFKIIQNTIII